MNTRRRALGGSSAPVIVSLAVAALASAAGAQCQTDSVARTLGGPAPSNIETAGQIYSEHLEAPGAEAPTARPKLQLTRWQEDWRALADPAKRTDLFDSLKYIPLAPDGSAHLVLSGQLREDYVSQSAPLSRGASADFGLHRLYLGADLHVGEGRVFAEIGNVEAPGERSPVPVTDRDDAALQLLFVDYRLYLGPALIIPRVGRQEIVYDTTQRFLGLREGPNNRQAFDAVRLDVKIATLALSSFASHPVAYAPGVFDDKTNAAVDFRGVNLTDSMGPDQQSVYVYDYRNRSARYGATTGSENRTAVGARAAGTIAAFDYDLEGMSQSGRVGDARIHAWAVGLVGGYTLRLPWSPRLGVQYDQASGDKNPADHRVSTFNPFFGKGAYFTEAPITGYANVRHLKGSLSLRPNVADTLTIAYASLAKDTSRDLVYLTPLIPQPKTGAMQGLHTGDYVQILGAHQFNAHLSLSGEAVRFAAAPELRRVGGSDVDYLKVVLNVLF